MFSRISSIVLFVFLTFTVFAAATSTVTVTSTPPPPTATPPPASQCNIDGGLQCCNNVGAANSGGLLGTIIAAALSLVGIAVSPVTAIVGVTCSPISLASIGNPNACTAQAVCCEDNEFNGVVNVGCTPVNILL